jgi:lipopolysaccharide/colanic/teichoic acid biosynthesis glycosyltransferase
MRDIIDAQCILRWAMNGLLLLLLVFVFGCFIVVAIKGIIIIFSSGGGGGVIYWGKRLDKANKMFRSARFKPLLIKGRMGNQVLPSMAN